MTASPDDAFDLVQETYLKAFTRIGQFDGRSSVATWLYRVAVNEALQFLRRASQTRLKLQEIAPENGTESDIEQSTVRLDINDALAALAPNDRAMLLLRYQEGLDYRAIADVVGCAAGTVASRLNRARQRLREILRNSYAVGEERGHGEHPKDVSQVSRATVRDGGRRRTGS
jgi:RNA polymerase sigma-70 factor (ECF subfamily)